MRLSFALFLHSMLMNELLAGEALMDLYDKPFHFTSSGTSFLFGFSKGFSLKS